MRGPFLVGSIALVFAFVSCAAHGPDPAKSAPAPAQAPRAPPTASAARAPTMLTRAPAPKADRVSFTLYKFLAEVGAERDTFVALSDGSTEAKALFSYRDRKRTVPLAATFVIGANGALRRYQTWGRTSRFTQLDDRIEAADDGSFDVTREGARPSRVKPAGLAVAASGYASMLAQDLMLRAWGEHGRPKAMALLPEGEVTIESRGTETYDGEAGKVTLEHVVVRGLVWGREDAWLDAKGELAAVVTRDAEFDHFEAVREGFDSLLPELARSTGADGVAWLAREAKSSERSAPGVLALVGGDVVDGTGRPAMKDAIVIVDGDRIVAVGSRAKTPIPPGAATIDVSGKTILPGLWDMHAHVEQVEQGAVYLAAGVTTVRDMGNVLDFITGVRDAIDAGKGLGPRVLVEGLVDGTGEAALGVVRIDTREQIAPTIDRLKKAGCVDVKIYSSVAPALVKPIVAYAHAHGMRAVGHVPNGMTTREAIDAGYDSISHLPFLYDAAVSDKEAATLSREGRMKRFAAIDLASPAMKGVIAAVVAHHVVIDDTESLYEQIFHTPEENARREPGIATLPRELQATLGGVPAALAAAGDAAFRKDLELIGELHRRGAIFVAGTDINVPGHSLHRELELYVMAGFTPMEAIQAATIVPARVMHLEKELGTIEVGKRADLVVVSGDPLADVSRVRKTALVVTRGRAYDSAALWRLAGFSTP